jgi:hypothetical protein
MLLTSLNDRATPLASAAVASQSPLQHLPGNVNTAGGFDSILADELTAPKLPPLPGTLQPQAAAGSPAMPGSNPQPPERQLSSAETQKIHSTAQQLESLMLYQMLKQMWESIPQSTLLPEGNAGQMYREMWLQQVADKASQAGGGVGIAKVVERELTDRAKRTFTPEQAAQLRQASAQ